MDKKFRHSWDSRSEFDRVRKNSKNKVRFVASFYAQIFFACHRHDLVSRLMETSRTGKKRRPNSVLPRYRSRNHLRGSRYALDGCDDKSTPRKTWMQRGHLYLMHLSPYAECISRSGPEGLWIFKFSTLFFFSSLVVRFYIHRCACPRFVFRRWWFAGNSHVYALIRRSKRKVSRNIRKQNVSSIDRYATPTIISRFIERINYFVTRDKHEQTNFVDTGFIGLLVEFAGRLLV